MCQHGVTAMFKLLILGVLIYFFVIWIHGYQNPTRKGKTDAKLTKNYEVQISADRAVRPKQGSSAPTIQESAGLLYLVSNKEFNSLKIGISRADSENDRVKSHLDYGWKLEKCWNFEDHSNAQHVEGATIAWWRNHLKVGPSVHPLDMPQGGYTETISLNSVSCVEVYEYVNTLCGKANGREAINSSINNLVVGAVMQTSGTLEFATLKTRTAMFKGDYRWHSKYHKWQQWVISENGVKLTIELNERNSTSLKILKMGSRVDVVGRVESVNGEFRMTNPVYTLHVTRLISRRKIEFTNKESWFGRRKLRQTRASDEIYEKSKSKKKTSNTESSFRPSTPIEKAARLMESNRPETDTTYLIERCSACGAPVPNGAKHDC